MPVNVGGVHWVLLVADVKTRRIRVLDSMAPSAGRGHTIPRMYAAHTRTLGLMLIAVEVQEAADGRRESPDLTPWAVEWGRCPQQLNSDDCGVFVAMAMIGVCMDGDGAQIPNWACGDDGNAAQSVIDQARIALGAVIVSIGCDEDVLRKEQHSGAVEGGKRVTRRREAKRKLDLSEQAGPSRQVHLGE